MRYGATEITPQVRYACEVLYGQEGKSHYMFFCMIMLVWEFVLELVAAMQMADEEKTYKSCSSSFDFGAAISVETASAGIVQWSD
jgi:hypothetical protein